MFRILVLLALLPTSVVAEWSPHPSMFSYDAAFDQCTIEPALASSTECADRLHGAYVLNRAVVWAMTDCADVTLPECAPSFEGHGLPAISIQIAADAGCDRSGLVALQAGEPLVPDQCIAIITDILRDEGVVPYIQEITCAGPTSDCFALARLQSDLWQGAIDQLSNSDLTKERIQSVQYTCRTNGMGSRAFYDCGSDGYANIWANLAQQTAQDQ